MRKLGGILLIGLLALTACSAPEQLQAQPLVGNGSSTTPDITAAPIPATPPAAETAAPESPYGDMTQDEFYLASVAPTWRGDMPTDTEFMAAGKLACEKLNQGEEKKVIRVVTATGEDADWNNDSVLRYAAQVYCPGLSSR